MGRKIALIIGNSRYDDPSLARLIAADVDVREFAGVLRTPEIGQFDEVVELPDEGLAVVRRSIARFFSQAKRDDLLVFYFSGHGVKDENGHLYLAVRDTEPQLLAGTSIEAAFITAQMDRSSSKRQVLILDCCHSGAFAHGAKAGAAQVVGTGPAFEGTGYGRVILTATDSTQYAWQGDQILGESDKSVFTHYLLEGLKTGEADSDGDGLITIDELYDYVYERVVSETPKQTPGKWSYKQQGDIVLARSPRPLARAAELPLELRALLDSPLSRLRSEAIPELAILLQGRHRGLALAARQALEDLRSDDSRKVSAAAEAVLATLSQQDEAAAVAARETARIRAEAEQLVVEASERLTRQELAGALTSVEAALQLDPSSNEALTLRDQIQLAIEEFQRKEEIERQIRERRQKVDAHISKANQAASHEEAIKALKEALKLDPGHEAASQLLERHNAALEQMAAERARLQKIDAARDRIEDLLNREELHQAQQVLELAEKDCDDPSAFKEVRQRLRDKQHDRLASEVVEGARRKFAAGFHVPAVAALERFHPRHPLVSRALEDLTAALDRLRQQEEERRRIEAERLAREQEVVTLRDTARSHLERQQFVEALRALHAAQQLNPEAAGLAELVETAEAGKIAAEEAARRRHESEDKLADALKRFRKRDFTRALALAEEACGIDPDNAAASKLRSEIQQALNARATAVDSAESVGQSRPSPWSGRPFFGLSRGQQVGLVAVSLAAGLLLLALPGREVPQPENTESRPAPPVPTQEASPPPAMSTPSPQPGTATAVEPSSAPIVEQSQAPAVEPSSAPTPSRSRGSRQSPAAVVPAPSSVETRIARFLAEGDRLMQARNYDGALSAYEEAGRLGSVAGRERAEKVGQEKTAQVRVRLNRVERLLDSGDYDEALRLIAEAASLEPKSSEIERMRQRVVDAQSFERALRRGPK